MAQRCENCHKGILYGHAVSHAKNRLRRLFRPNLQKLKVLKDGIAVRVKFCTSCIKRLKKDGKRGIYSLVKLVAPAVALPLPPQPVKEKKAVVEEKKKEALKIEEIVGRKK